MLHCVLLHFSEDFFHTYRKILKVKLYFHAVTPLYFLINQHLFISNCSDYYYFLSVYLADMRDNQFLIVAS